MYKKITAAITGIIMITALFASLGVTAGSPSSVTGPTPSKVTDDTRVKLTISVTNETGDNIENILIRNVENVMDEAIGGHYPAENLKLAADNLDNAVDPLMRAGDNIRIAAENVKASAGYFDDIGGEIYVAGTDFGKVTPLAWSVGDNTAEETTNYALIRNALHEAKTSFDKIADMIATEPLDLASIADNLKYAGSKLQAENYTDNLDTDGDGVTIGREEAENRRMRALENLLDAGSKIENAAENYIAGGNFGKSADLLTSAAENLRNAETNLTNDPDGYAVAAGADLGEIASYLDEVAAKLTAASGRLNDAGTALGTAENYMTSAGNLIELADSVDLLVAGDNLENAALMLEAAENQLKAPENFLAAGDNLVAAAAYMASSAGSLGIALGGDDLDKAADDIDAAGDNIKTASTVNLTTAGDKLIDAASDLRAVASKIDATAGDLKPTNWTLNENTPQAKDVLFQAENSDYYLAPGASQDYTFLWKTPDLTNTENDLSLNVWLQKEDGSWVGPTVLTLTVDGKAPTVSITVMQEGVPVNNLVGDTYQAGAATVKIVASEELSSIGDVTVENATDNLLPPLSLTTADNITFISTFEVGEWDDYNTVIKVASATDLIGNDNFNLDNQPFDVDTREPVFLDSGIPGLKDALVQKVQAGTGNLYWADNSKSKTISGSVEDNFTGTIAGHENWETFVVDVSIEWNGNLIQLDRAVPPTPDNSFTEDITLAEGLTTSVIVRATDWTGNVEENSLENIFIDVEKPEIEFGTITGVGYTKDLTDGVYVNDNTPKISLTITDPGYPDTGLGVWYDNLDVYLDDDDNVLNGPGYFSLDIENTEAWDPSTGLFENIIENAGAGLSDGTYYITAAANDNLNENATASVKFIIDTVKPSISSEPTETTIELGTSANPTMSNEETLELSGTAESGATVEILVNGEVKATTTAGSPWSATVTLEEGKNKISAKAIDAAGNENSVTYGYILSDFTGPSIDVEEPSEGALLPSKSVTVSGTVTDNITSVRELTVNGTEVAVATDGSFSTSVTVDEGPRTINLSATDEAGNTSVSTVSITVDATRPIAEITAPETGLLTKEGSVTVVGKAYDEVTSIVEATLNGEAISLAADGTFSESVSLDLGSNTVTLSARDEADHYATDSITVLSDTAPPTVSITAPEPDTTTGKATILVEGSVSDEPPETSVTVTVDAAGTSKEVTLTAAGSFSTTVPLPTGETIITVSAVDEAGNSTVKSVSVTRTAPTNWMIYATFAAIIAIILAAIAIIRRRS